MTRELPLLVGLVFSLAGVVITGRWIDNRRDARYQITEEQLYLDGKSARRISLAFNGLAADWYWIRSLQYVGGKVVAFEDTHQGQFGINDLATLDLRQLPLLLRITTTLDPQFITAYEYGAVILPEVNQDEAIPLLNRGIAANPSSWKLYQHLGYIYWQRKDYEHANEAYAAAARIPNAPTWLGAMAARMKGEGGSRKAAREMYQHLYDAADDDSVRAMVQHHLMRLDSLDERDAIRRVLQNFEVNSRDGRCPSAWGELTSQLRAEHLRIEVASGAALDPTGVPYRLIKGGCDVDLDPSSKVPR